MRLVLATAAVVAAAVLTMTAGVGAHEGHGSPRRPRARPSTAITRIVEPARPMEVRLVPAEDVSAIAFGGGALWAPGIGQPLRIDPRTLRPAVGPSLFACQDGQVAAGLGAVWISGGDCAKRGQVDQIDPRSLRLIRRIRLPVPADGIAIWRGAVWVTTPVRQSSRLAVLRIAPEGGRIAAVGGGFSGADDPSATFATTPLVVAGRDALWTEANNGGLIAIRLAPSGLARAALLDPDTAVGGLTYGGERIWAGFAAAVEPLDPRTGAVDGFSVVPQASAAALVWGDGRLWIADGDGSLYVYTPGAPLLVRVAQLSQPPAVLAYGGGYLWAAFGGDGRIARIGPVSGTAVSRSRARVVPPASAPIA